ncbi:MAG: lipoyl(octanoyl) transferase LipB [Bacillota bacterium]
MSDIGVVWLGRRPYEPVWELQKGLVQARRSGCAGDVLLFVEHPHTYTLGRRGDPGHLLVGQDQLSQEGIPFVRIDRGGDITYHGPGQLVGYPIVDLSPWNRDLVRYVRMLEDVLIRALGDFGVKARREEGYTGVWTDRNKVAAIGVKVSGGVTSHGFALNVGTDLSYFERIIPCGIQDRGVTSLSRLLGRSVDLDEARGAVTRQFAQVFGVQPRPLTPEELLA